MASSPFVVCHWPLTLSRERSESAPSSGAPFRFLRIGCECHFVSSIRQAARCCRVRRSNDRRESCSRCRIRSPRKCPPHCASVSEQRSRRSEEHTSELQSRPHLVCRLLLEKKNKPQSTTSCTS